MNTIKNTMSFILVILILYSSNGSTQTLSNSLVFIDSTITMTSGLNPTTKELLPDSDWDIKYTTANAGSCSAFTGVGNIFNDGLVYKTSVSYKSKTSLDCLGITLSDDPYGVVSWLDQGIVQESFFNDEILSCGVGTTCEANQTINYENKTLSTINPTPGGNATTSGKMDIIIYNTKNLNFNSSNGSYGLGGVADLPKKITKTKFCVYLRDSTTDGRTSNYAKNPEVAVKVITWRPVIEGPNASNGVNTSVQNKSTILKGLDSSMRYWIGRDVVIEN